MGTRATLVRLGLIAVAEPVRGPVATGGEERRHGPAPTRQEAGAAGGVVAPLPLSPQRLRLRADLAYALAAVDGRRRVAAEDLATADRLAVRLLDRWNRPAVAAPVAHRRTAGGE